MTVDSDGEFASKLGDRLKYGLRQALKKLLESWGVPSNLGEKIATNGFAFIIGSYAFKNFINKNAKAHSINIAQVKVFAKSSAKSLIAYVKKNLIKVLGKKAASMMIGGAVDGSRVGSDDF